MNKSIAIANTRQSLCTIYHCAATSTSLTIPDSASDSDLSSLGTFLSNAESASQWWMGDYYIALGKRYGETYSDNLPFADGTKQNCVAICKAFETSRRRENLTFSHHCEVSALDPREQDRWLDLAEQHNLSKRALRRSIAEGRLITDSDKTSAITTHIGRMTPDSLSVFYHGWQRQMLGKHKSVSDLDHNTLVRLEKNLRDQVKFYQSVVDALSKTSARVGLTEGKQLVGQE